MTRRTALVTSFVLFACVQGVIAQKASGTNLRGSVSGRQYTNDYFGFGLELPKAWIPFSEEDEQIAKGMTAEASKGTSEQANKILDKTYEESVTLIFYAKLPMGSVDNASLAITAKPSPSKYITARMVVEGTKSAMLKNPKAKLVSDTEVEVISGKSMAKLELEIDVAGNRTPLRYYVFIDRGYIITVSMSSMAQDSWAVAENSFRSIKFHN